MNPAHLVTAPFDPSTPYASRENSRDGYPGVVKPLDLTTLSTPNDRGMRQCLRDLGYGPALDPPGMLCTRVFQGRLYVNISWALWKADAVPGISAADFEQQLFGQHAGLAIDRPKISVQEKVVSTLMIPNLALGYWRAVAGRGRRLEQALAARAAFAPAGLSDSQIAALVPALRAEVEKGSGWNSRGTTFAITCIGALTRAAGPRLAHLLLPLLSDVGEVESAAPSRRIQALARQGRQARPGLAEALAAAEDRWAALERAAPELKAGLDALLARYGYRSVAEFYLTAPSWSEDPTPVMDAFVGLLQQPDAAREEGPPAGLKAILKNVPPLRRWWLTVLAKGARLGAQTRETTKAAWVIRVDIVRKLMRHVGRRMADRGHLKDPEDLYFLTLDEVLAYLRTGRTEGFAEAIARRRGVCAALEQGPEPPDLMVGDAPLEPAKASGDGAVGSTMSGMGVSGGVVEGLARVVRNTDALDAFEPDEILVAPYTDAGWTPYFTLAAAVIVENGGLLTHTSVVARELGLPALTNVRNATTLIRTGDRLRLDADKGEVEILARAAP